MLGAGRLSLLLAVTVARSEVEFHSNSDHDSDALGIEELEREIAQQLERIPANLEIDSDPEPMMSSSLVLSQPQEIPLAIQSGTQPTIRSTKGHQHVRKQTPSEGREIEDARIGINAYLQCGHKKKD